MEFLSWKQKQTWTNSELNIYGHIEHGTDSELNIYGHIEHGKKKKKNRSVYCKS
jgi:hypothetical protein